MNRNFYPISQKINSIQVALLRYHVKDENITQHVVMKAYDDQTIICALTDTTKPSFRKMTGRRVNLIQKSNNDYIYLSGVVLEKEGINKRTLYIKLFKACWFVRKSKGTLSWLQEKHCYDDTIRMEKLELAS